MTAVRNGFISGMLKIANHLWYLAVAVIVTLVLGVLIYNGLEGYGLVHSFEWAVQTVTSTGYGNYTAQTTAGSLFTSFYMLWGVGVMLTLVTATVINALRKDPNVFTDAEQEEILSYVREQRARQAEVDRKTLT